MLLLTNEDIEAVLDMKTCLEALEIGYRDLVRNDATYRPRSDLVVTSAPTTEFPDAHFRFGSMEGACRSLGTFAMRMKSDVSHTLNGRLQKYCVQPGTYYGIVLLFSLYDAAPLAIMHDGFIQHMRVGGTGGLGAKYLARPDASVVGMIGAGGMARANLSAFSELFSIRLAKVYSPTKENRERFAAEMSEQLGFPVETRDSAEDVMRGSHIVATCTDSASHVVTDPDWLEPGMHLTDNTQSEWAAAVVRQCQVKARLAWSSIQSPEPGTQRIGGENIYAAGQPEELAKLAKAKPEEPEGVASWPHLADIMAGRNAGRTSAEEISFFNNHGSQGLQFAAVGQIAYELAKKAGVGRELPIEWFVEDVRN